MIKARLKELRNEKGLNQRELAAALNLSPSTIGMYETGQRVPDAETLNRIADFFNTSVDYLIGRTDNRKRIADAVNDPAAHYGNYADYTDQELEDILQNSNIRFYGEPLDEEAKQDVLQFLRMLLKRKDRKAGGDSKNK